MIAVSTLLKSCATPPASWPTACILVACATWRLRRVSSVVSARLSSTAASPSPRTPARPSETGSSGSARSRTAMSPLDAGPWPKRRTASDIAVLSCRTTRSEGYGGMLAVDPGGAAERRVGEQEVPVAVGHRQAERELLEQPFELRRLAARLAAPAAEADAAVEQHHQRGRLARRARSPASGSASGTLTSVCGLPLRPSRAK